MFKIAAVVGTCIAIGALVGNSGVLCPDGSCAITGTWVGGSMLGGAIGAALSGLV